MNDPKRELLQALEDYYRSEGEPGEMSIFTADELGTTMDMFRMELAGFGSDLDGFGHAHGSLSGEEERVLHGLRRRASRCMFGPPAFEFRSGVAGMFGAEPLGEVREHVNMVVDAHGRRSVRAVAFPVFVEIHAVHLIDRVFPHAG